MLNRIIHFIIISLFISIGLGEGIVSGKITPDRHIVYRKKLLSICKEIISVAKNNRSNGKIGFVTHHNDMNKDDWNNYYFILSELNKVGCQELLYNEIRSTIRERN